MLKKSTDPDHYSFLWFWKQFVPQMNGRLFQFFRHAVNHAVWLVFHRRLSLTDKTQISNQFLDRVPSTVCLASSWTSWNLEQRFASFKWGMISMTIWCNDSKFTTHLLPCFASINKLNWIQQQLVTSGYIRDQCAKWTILVAVTSRDTDIFR